ncbi:unnamed protein product, partial [Ixodes persulcatus]
KEKEGKKKKKRLGRNLCIRLRTPRPVLGSKDEQGHVLVVVSSPHARTWRADWFAARRSEACRILSRARATHLRGRRKWRLARKIPGDPESGGASLISCQSAVSRWLDTHEAPRTPEATAGHGAASAEVRSVGLIVAGRVTARNARTETALARWPAEGPAPAALCRRPRKPGCTCSAAQRGASCDAVLGALGPSGVMRSHAVLASLGLRPMRAGSARTRGHVEPVDPSVASERRRDDQSRCF